MKAHARRLFLAVVARDATFERVEVRGGGEAWAGKCIHCGAAVLVRLDGAPLGTATLEHVVPRAHGGTDDLDNLAIACARCNHQKGRRQDLRGPGDPGFDAVVATLRARLDARRRAAPLDLTPPTPWAAAEDDARRRPRGRRR